MDVKSVGRGILLAWQVAATYPTVGGGEIQLLYSSGSCPQDKFRVSAAELSADGRVIDMGCSTPQEGYQIIDWVGGGTSVIKNSKFTWDKPVVRR
jgi:hypothetical protein